MTTTLRRLQRVAGGFNAKARRHHVKGVITPAMLIAKGDTCAYCGIALGLPDGTWDHVIAFDRGGSNVPENIVRCCMTCQRTKFTKTPAEFAEHREMLVTCALPGCSNTWQPRYAEQKRGMARYCSRSHAAKSRWVQ